MIFVIPSHALDVVKQNRFESEYRIRFERRMDRDFSDMGKDNRTDIFQRVRVGMKFDGDNSWSGFAQFQFAHDLATSPNLNNSDESRDILLAYAQRKTDREKLTLGRQKIVVGSERLIGALEWVNRSRSFDAVRYQNSQFDAFGAEVAIQNQQPQKARIAGVTLPTKFGATSLFFKHDQAGSNSVDHWTLSESSTGKVLGLGYDFEGALQSGHNAGKAVEAWAFHLQTNKTLSAKSNVALEWNAASGSSANSSKVRTFDNLYPTNHKFYGLMDMHAWKNLDQVALTLNNKVRSDIDVKARVGKSWLRDSRGAWYGANGTPNKYSVGNFIDPSGASGKDLGLEWDLESVWRKNANESFLFGVGLYQPGHFVSNLTGRNQSQVFTCLQYSLRF